MTKSFNRRDFLKLASLATGSLLFSEYLPSLSTASALAQGGQNPPPNIIIFVFDAMTASNLSLYGYHRQTTPNLQKFAERATVYHSHQSGGNFTTPGTASLLTGMYPWTHRAINQGGLIARNLVGRNFFSLMGNGYHRLAYSQNLWANYLFEQFPDGIDTILPPGSFSAVEEIIGERFPKHRDDTYRSYDDFLFKVDQPPASLLFGLLGRFFLKRETVFSKTADYSQGFPRAGDIPLYFRVADVFDGVQATIQKLVDPYFAYFHLWAPHAPYSPVKPFDGMFNDNLRLIPKPQHPLGYETNPNVMKAHRLHYDEYIANVDAEFGRIIKNLEDQGVLDKAFIIVTSDHGESFERGADGHAGHLLFQPLIHIPLLISIPGQKEHRDITTPTSCIDILPSLLTLTGKPIPEWCEGKLLPGLGGEFIPQRSIFSVNAGENPAYTPLKQQTSIAMRKDNYKLHCYTSFFDEDLFELYDIEADPEEMTNLYPSAPAVAKTLKDEILSRLQEANAPFEKS